MITIKSRTASRVLAIDGISTAPSMAFQSEPTLGWYRSAASVMTLVQSKNLAVGSITVNGLSGGVGNLSIVGDLARPFTQTVSTIAVSAPSSGNGMLRWEVGTNAGTLKLVAYSGTSTTGVTIVDNVGAGN